MTLVVVRTISTWPGPREDRGPLGVLLEKAPHLDRREPVERQRKGFEEQEDGVADAGGDERGDHRERLAGRPNAPGGPLSGIGRPSRRRIRASSASICAVVGLVVVAHQVQAGRARAAGRSPRARRLAAPPRFALGIGHRDHDVAQKPASGVARRERQDVGRAVLPAVAAIESAHPPVGAEEHGDFPRARARARAAARRSGAARGRPRRAPPARPRCTPTRSRRTPHRGLPPETGRGPAAVRPPAPRVRASVGAAGAARG